MRITEEELDYLGEKYEAQPAENIDFIEVVENYAQSTREMVLKVEKSRKKSMFFKGREKH